MSQDFIISSGFCYEIHKAKPQRFECFGSFVNIIKGIICMGMFVYILAKMNNNHRRALAGYTKNTINIDVHMTMMILVGYWTISWGALNIFNVSNTDAGDNLKTEEARLFAVAHGVCYSISSFVELVILLLLCSSSIGKNNFNRSWLVASSWAFATFITSIFVILYRSGPDPVYWISRNMELTQLIRAILTVVMNIGALIFYYMSGSDRNAVTRYSKYLVGIYTMISISQGLEFSNNFISVNIGICALDISELIHFSSFAPVVYLTLKRDCQYWSEGVDDDEEVTLINHANEITWSELPNYKDVVIPKTELYYRSKIMEQVDVSVEIHLWRRKLTVVKRFKFDLLTRDNIKFFKAEANIFQRLSHENIVDFYGVLVDPPSLGIVMKFCSNGDVFKRIEKEREKYEKEFGKKLYNQNNNSNNINNNNNNNNNNGISNNSSIILNNNSISINNNNNMIDTDNILESKITGRSYLMLTDQYVVNAIKSGNNIDIIDIESGNRSPLGKLPDGTPITRSLSGSKMIQSSNRLGSIRASLMSSRHGDNTPNQFDPLFCALQVAKGMAYLHSQDITHRDLKSMNVLLDEGFNAKIADFGESIIDHSNRNANPTLRSGYHGEMGTAGWAAPEMILGKGASKTSDVFSFGVVLWELLTWRVPSILITVKILLEDSVSMNSSTFNNPLLRLVKEQRNIKKDKKKEKDLPVSGGMFSVFSHETKGNSFKQSSARNPLTPSIPLMNVGHSDSSRGRSRSRSFAEGTSPTADETIQTKNPVNTRYPGDLTITTSFNYDDKKTDNSYSDSVLDHNDRDSHKKNIPTILDTDLTMVEISDMRIAEELMCNRHLRPPLPIGIPKGLRLLLDRCWCIDPQSRPSFPEILSELEKCIIQQRDQYEITLPCAIQAEMNYAMDYQSISSIEL